MDLFEFCVITILSYIAGMVSESEGMSFVFFMIAIMCGAVFTISLVLKFVWWVTTG